MSNKDFNQIVDFAEYYFSSGNMSAHPAENEVTAYIIIPILRSIGWDSKYISYERKFDTSKRNGNADIILHNILDKSELISIVGIIEVKKHYKFTKEQDILYAKAKFYTVL